MPVQSSVLFAPPVLPPQSNFYEDKLREHTNKVISPASVRNQDEIDEVKALIQREKDAMRRKQLAEFELGRLEAASGH